MLLLPSHWSELGVFDTESECNAFGQKFINQLGHLPPRKGYTRETAAMTILDTRGGTDKDIQHEVQTTLYCISEDADPRVSAIAPGR